MITRATLLLCILGLAACTPEATAKLYHCDAFDDQFACSQLSGAVCARADTGVRCIQAPCPSSTLRSYVDACAACGHDKVDLVFTGSCELLRQQLDSGELEPR